MKRKLFLPAAFLLFLSMYTYSQVMLADWESTRLSFLSYPEETCADPRIDFLDFTMANAISLKLLSYSDDPEYDYYTCLSSKCCQIRPVR